MKNKKFLSNISVFRNLTEKIFKALVIKKPRLKLLKRG